MALVHNLHPTKWSVYNPWLYKMVVPVTCFDPPIFWQFSQKWSNQCIHDFIKHIKIPEPFCRASILARPQRQLPFSQCHFVGFLPSRRLHSSFSEGPCFFMQLLQHEYFSIFLPTMCWQSFWRWKRFPVPVCSSHKNGPKAKTKIRRRMLF